MPACRLQAVEHDLLNWRAEFLITAGCEPLVALELAADERVDLHAVCELLDRGCPPELAARIVAPLDA